MFFNAKIQACINLIGNHANKSCLGKESSKKSSFLSSRVHFSMYQIFQNFESLYNILHILTQVDQTSCLVTHFCAQAVFKVPVNNTFPTHKTRCPEGVKRIELTESFRQCCALVSLARIFQCVNFFFDTPCKYRSLSQNFYICFTS